MKRGFSLLELILVMAIIAIIAGIAVSNITNRIKYAQAKSLVEQFISDIQWVRSLALKYNSATIKFYSNKYEIYAPSASVAPKKIVNLPSGVSISENFGSSLDFLSNTLPEENGTITFNAFGKTYRIVINLNGGIRLEE